VRALAICCNTIESVFGFLRQKIAQCEIRGDKQAVNLVGVTKPDMKVIAVRQRRRVVSTYNCKWARSASEMPALSKSVVVS
jgi:hypothetical protein